jgi:hypothetical protein
MNSASLHRRKRRAEVGPVDAIGGHHRQLSYDYPERASNPYVEFGRDVIVLPLWVTQYAGIVVMRGGCCIYLSCVSGLGTRVAFCQSGRAALVTGEWLLD